MGGNMVQNKDVFGEQRRAILLPSVNHTYIEFTYKQKACVRMCVFLSKYVFMSGCMYEWVCV